MNVMIENSNTVNEEAVIRFYSKMEATYPDKKLFLSFQIMQDIIKK
jgi:hypothetical protein